MTDDETNPESWDFRADEEVGRNIETPLGAPELVVMKRVFWAYHDWLRTQGFKTEALIRHCYKRHPEMRLSAALPWLLNHLALHRQAHDLPNPEWMVVDDLPPGFEEF
jgi:hypothetical protein